MSAEISVQNFDALTIGALAGFVNASGNTGTFGVTATGAISGTKAFGPATLNDGDIAIYNTAVANDICIQYSQPILAGGGGRSIIGPLLRSSDTNGTNAYALDIVPTTGAITLYKKTGAAFTPISWATGGTITPIASGNVVSKIEAQGSAIRVKVWAMGSTEPGPFSGTATDATYGSGKIGLRTGFGAGYSGQVASIDDFYVGDPGATFPGPTTGTVTGLGVATVGTSEIFTLTITGDGGSSPPWSGTPTLTLSDPTAGTITQFSAFLSASSGTASILWSKTGTYTVNATFPDSLVAGSSQSVVVTSGVSPTICTITGPGTATVGTPITMTATLNNAAGLGGVTLTEAITGSAGTTSPHPVVIPQGQVAANFSFTGTAAGTALVGGTAV